MHGIVVKVYMSMPFMVVTLDMYVDMFNMEFFFLDPHVKYSIAHI